MGHTVESRPRGSGRPPGTRPSHGYRSATHVHVQARLRMQDAPAFTSAALLRRREVLPKQQHRQVSVCPASMTALIALATGVSRTALVATAATGRVGVQAQGGL
jgi:hypothetical protein